MVEIFTLIFVGLCWVYSSRVNGIVSLHNALLLGITLYSVPVIIGFYLSPRAGGLQQIPVTSGAQMVFLWAWMWVFIGIFFLSNLSIFKSSRQYFVPREIELSIYDRRASCFCVLCLVLSLSLYLWIALIDSPLYFLDDRSITNEIAERQKLLWKWVNLYGLIGALAIRSRFLVLIFLTFLLMHFLAGDRTMVLISGVALGVYFLQGERSIRKILGPKYLLIGVFIFTLLLFGKPIYYSVKLQSISPMHHFLTPSASSKSILLSFFEPFITHTILEDVMRSNFTYSWVEVGRGVVGQLLLVPSAFGVDSSAFNVSLQHELYAHLKYGIANNYYAQAWSLGGIFGVAIFSLLLVIIVTIFAELALKASPLPRIMFVIMGVVVATYFYRNSLENILSMLRQVFIVGVPLLLATQLLAPRHPQPTSLLASE